MRVNFCTPGHTSNFPGAGVTCAPSWAPQYVFRSEQTMTTTSARAPLAHAGEAPRADIPAKTLRTDWWWIPPALTVIGLSAWLAYSLIRVYLHKWYYVADFRYLTPF